MVTIEFNYPLNTSVQVGDLAFAQQVLTTTYAEADGGISGLELIGEISAINDRATNNPSIVINNENFIPFANDFICFAKNNQANASSLKGYYAKVKFSNSSKEKAELFGVTAEIQQSSK